MHTFLKRKRSRKELGRSLAAGSLTAGLLLGLLLVVPASAFHDPGSGLERFEIIDGVATPHKMDEIASARTALGLVEVGAGYRGLWFRVNGEPWSRAGSFTDTTTRRMEPQHYNTVAHLPGTEDFVVGNDIGQVRILTADSGYQSLVTVSPPSLHAASLRVSPAVSKVIVAPDSTIVFCSTRAARIYRAIVGDPNQPLYGHIADPAWSPPGNESIYWRTISPTADPRANPPEVGGLVPKNGTCHDMAIDPVTGALVVATSHGLYLSPAESWGVAPDTLANAPHFPSQIEWKRIDPNVGGFASVAFRPDGSLLALRTFSCSATGGVYETPNPTAANPDWDQRPAGCGRGDIVVLADGRAIAASHNHGGPTLEVQQAPGQPFTRIRAFTDPFARSLDLQDSGGGRVLLSGSMGVLAVDPNTGSDAPSMDGLTGFEVPRAADTYGFQQVYWSSHRGVLVGDAFAQHAPQPCNGAGFRAENGKLYPHLSVSDLAVSEEYVFAQLSKGEGHFAGIYRAPREQACDPNVEWTHVSANAWINSARGQGLTYDETTKTLFATSIGTGNRGKVHASVDRGVTWKELTGLPTVINGAPVISPAGSVILTADYNSVYESTNHSSFIEIGGPSTGILDNVAEPVRAHGQRIAFSDRGIWFGAQDGLYLRPTGQTTWQKLGEIGRPGVLGISSVTVDDDHVTVTVDNERNLDLVGIWESEDGGATFNRNTSIADPWAAVVWQHPTAPSVQTMTNWTEFASRN